jgi:hypothetical protein
MSVKPLENRLELNTMCNLSEGIVDRVTERVTERVTAEVTESVTKQKTIEDVRNLMVNLRLDINQAMDALNVPTEMRADVRKALGK